MDLPDLSKPLDTTHRQSKVNLILDCYFHRIILTASTKTLSQITSEGLGLGDKADYINVKAVATIIKKDSVVYMVRKKSSQKNILALLDVSRR